MREREIEREIQRALQLMLSLHRETGGDTRKQLREDRPISNEIKGERKRDDTRSTVEGKKQRSSAITFSCVETCCYRMRCEALLWQTHRRLAEPHRQTDRHTSS